MNYAPGKSVPVTPARAAEEPTASRDNGNLRIAALSFSESSAARSLRRRTPPLLRRVAAQVASCAALFVLPFIAFLTLSPITSNAQVPAGLVGVTYWRGTLVQVPTPQGFHGGVWNVAMSLSTNAAGVVIMNGSRIGIRPAVLVCMDGRGNYFQWLPALHRKRPRRESSL